MGGFMVGIRGEKRRRRQRKGNIGCRERRRRGDIGKGRGRRKSGDR